MSFDISKDTFNERILKNVNFLQKYDCLEYQLSFEIDLDFGKLKIPSNRSINLTIRKKFIKQIKPSMSGYDYSQMIVDGLSVISAYTR